MELAPNTTMDKIISTNLITAYNKKRINRLLCKKQKFISNISPDIDISGDEKIIRMAPLNLSRLSEDLRNCIYDTFYDAEKSIELIYSLASVSEFIAQFGKLPVAAYCVVSSYRIKIPTYIIHKVCSRIFNKLTHRLEINELFMMKLRQNKSSWSTKIYDIYEMFSRTCGLYLPTNRYILNPNDISNTKRDILRMGEYELRELQSTSDYNTKFYLMMMSDIPNIDKYSLNETSIVFNFLINEYGSVSERHSLFNQMQLKNNGSITKLYDNIFPPELFTV